MDQLTYSAVQARQSSNHKVLSFAAKASDLIQFATIDRINRDAQGVLSGFQRPQVLGHIREIKDYLEGPEAVLPNPIVVAFIDKIDLTETDDGLIKVTIDCSNGPPGTVVDGQQRMSALSELENKDFEVFVSALICKDEAELRRQFVLINNTKPLPKSLIYELLPTVDGLPSRLSGRSQAAELTGRLNYDPSSSLFGLIQQHTNPSGIIKDTSIQRVVMNSLSDGMMREFMQKRDGEEKSFLLISEFYRAVQKVFRQDWENHTPRTSRLVHGAGIMSLGYVMEVLALLDGARSWEDFAVGLSCLDGRTAWTSGEWALNPDDQRNWRAVQNVNRDIISLAQYLIGIVRTDIRNRKKPTNEPPLLQTIER